jgi:hypothetical protein
MVSGLVSIARLTFLFSLRVAPIPELMWRLNLVPAAPNVVGLFRAYDEKLRRL